jgi:hypothetical protein
MAAIHQAIENLYTSLNLNTPVMRAVVTGGAVAGVLSIVQPDLMYIAGAPRPWDATTDATAEGTIPPTAVPWWLAATGAGLLAGILI